MKTNVKRQPAVTHGGGRAVTADALGALRRTLMACMLWEDEFYEDGESIAQRFAKLVPEVDPAAVSALAIEARTAGNLRHAPLLLAREMCRHAKHRPLVAATLVQIIK